MLTRLIYASLAICPSDADLPEILDWSRRVNPDLGVTGVLLYLDGVYMQYLEGDEPVVAALFGSIRKDTKHRGVTQFDQRAVSKRAFPSWSLATLDWLDSTRAIFRSFSPGTKLDLYKTDPCTAAPMIRALVRAPGWKLM